MDAALNLSSAAAALDLNNIRIQLMCPPRPPPLPAPPRPPARR